MRIIFVFACDYFHIYFLTLGTKIKCLVLCAADQNLNVSCILNATIECWLHPSFSILNITRMMGILDIRHQGLYKNRSG